MLVLDLISPENEDDDENEGGGRWVPSFSCSSSQPPWHPAGFIADDNLAPLRPKRVPSATGTDAAIGNDRDYTCEVELTIGEAKGEATI